jgi:hypothetical protein
MSRKTVLLLPCLLAFPSGLLAQGVQKSDVSVMFGVRPGTSLVVSGLNARLSTSEGVTFQYGHGYQVLQTSAGNLWLELPMTFVLGRSTVISIGSISGGNEGYFLTPGIRYHLPAPGRVSAYGMVGGGYGSFGYYRVSGASGSSVTTTRTIHGAFDVGGGLEVRLTRRLGLRMEVRDFISGRGLGGAEGRNHVVVLGGMALHF